MKYFWFIILVANFLFLSIKVNAMCFERFYTEAHLRKHTQQVVKNIVMDLKDDYSHETLERADLKLQIQMVDKNKKPVVATVSANCLYEKDTFRNKAICQIQSPGQGSFSLVANSQYGYSKDYFTVKLSPDSLFVDETFIPKDSSFENQVLNSNSFSKSAVRTITIPKYDHTMRVNMNPIVSNVKSLCEPIMFKVHTSNPSRFWIEVILYSIRNDLARPTVTARNLYHLSALMWDVYSSYENKNSMFLASKAPEFTDIETARNVAMSYAAYTYLMQRYKNAPINTGDQYPIGDGDSGDGKPDLFLNQTYDRVIQKFDFDLVKYKSHKDFGVEFARQFLAMNLNDGSRESENYKPAPGYVLVNPMVTDISQSGLRGLMVKPLDDLFNDFFRFMETTAETEAETAFQDYENLPLLFNTKPYLGPILADQVNIDHWVRLNIPGAIDQGGTAVASEQSPLTLFWGQVKTFSDLRAYESPTKPGVYFDPGASLPKYSTDPDQVIRANAQVVEFSSYLNPLDMSAYDFDRDGSPDQNPGSQLMDISPRSLGNNPLGSNDGQGRDINPFTKKPYEQNLVKKANYYRSIAEFWADGPESETPPGHWNSIANYVLDQMSQMGLPKKWKGLGEELSDLEYELRLYLSLNGALHDAAIAAWGIKGHYQGNRPVSVIRKFAQMAENDPVFAKKLTSLSKNFKMVTYEKNETDVDGKVTKKMVTKLAVKAWRGPRVGKYYEVDITGPELRDLSFRFRDSKSKEENQLFIDNGIAGVGWILADNWVPYQRQTFVTPPFPGFVSGHSTFSRAAAEVLSAVTGSEYFPGGLGVYKAPELHFEFSEEQPFEFHWATYFDAADVSGLSRIYGGIHATYDDLPARKLGSKVGQEAVKTADRFFNP